MTSNMQDVQKDVFEIYQRLFDHSSAIRGEANYFFNNFKDGNDVQPSTSSSQSIPSTSSLETLLKCRQLVSEAGDIDWPKTIHQSDIDKVTVKLDAAAFMIEKLVRRGRMNAGQGPYEEYVERSKQEQRKELQRVSADVKRQTESVDKEFEEKVSELRRQYNNLAGHTAQ